MVDINAYDQPGVEAGKKAAADIISIQQKIKLLFEKNDFLTIEKINERLENSDPESIFLILRQMCFNNNNFNIQGNWSVPDSLKIRKL